MSKKDPRPYHREGIGILNQYGDLWTSDVFDDEASAKRHLERFWHGNKSAPDLAKYRFAPVEQVTSVKAP